MNSVRAGQVKNLRSVAGCSLLKPLCWMCKKEITGHSYRIALGRPIGGKNCHRACRPAYFKMMAEKNKKMRYPTSKYRVLNVMQVFRNPTPFKMPFVFSERKG